MIKRIVLGLLFLLCSLHLCGQSITGNITSGSGAGNCVSLTVNPNNTSTVYVDVSGTWSATLQPEVLIAGGTVRNVQVTPTSSQTPQSTITANGGFWASAAGVDTFQLCATAFSSGPAVVTLRATPGVAASLFTGSASGNVSSVGGTAPIASSGGTTPTISITGAAGAVLAGAGPAFTATPSLGTAGSVVGTLSFANATSGSVTLSPVTGALGAVTISLPAATGTAAIDSASDTTTSHVLHATATGHLYTSSAIAVGDLPTAIPIGNVGSAGLSGTAPITISAAGAIACATCNTSSATVTSVAQTVPSGFAIAGSPVTTSGTLAVTYSVSAAGQIIDSSGANAAGFTATPTLGVQATTAGSLTIAGTSGTSGTITLNGGTSGSAAITTSATGVLALPSGATATNMALTTPNVGTPSAETLTNATGLGTSGITPNMYAVDTGVVNAYVVALSPAMTAYTTGVIGCFKAANASTTNNPTVNFNGLGVKTIVKLGNIVLAGGDIGTVEPVCVLYDGANFDLLTPQQSTGSGGGVLATAPTFLTSITTPLIKTTTKCAAVGSAANPSVAACTAAPAGVFSCSTSSVGNCQVNTTAMISANSTVIVTQDASTTTGTLLGVTCNTTPSAVVPSVITAKVATTSFSFSVTTPVTNPDCFQYLIVN